MGDLRWMSSQQRRKVFSWDWKRNTNRNRKKRFKKKSRNRPSHAAATSPRAFPATLFSLGTGERTGPAAAAAALGDHSRASIRRHDISSYQALELYIDYIPPEIPLLVCSFFLALGAILAVDVAVLLALGEAVRKLSLEIATAVNGNRQWSL